MNKEKKKQKDEEEEKNRTWAFRCECGEENPIKGTKEELVGHIFRCRNCGKKVLLKGVREPPEDENV